MQSKRNLRPIGGVASGLSRFWTYARHDLLGSEPVRLMLWQRTEARRRQLVTRRPAAVAAGPGAQARTSFS